jgi:hypothetical protein
LPAVLDRILGRLHEEDMLRIILALTCLFAISVRADAEDVPCLGGSPDVFKFVKWQLKNTAPDNTEVTLTVHNQTDTTFKDSEIKIRYGEWHQFFFKLKAVAKAKKDVTFMNPFGMPAADATMLQGIVPTLCAVKTIDDHDAKKYYD